MCEDTFANLSCINGVITIANVIITIVTIVKKSDEGLKLNDSLMLKDYLTIISQYRYNI